MINYNGRPLVKTFTGVIGNIPNYYTWAIFTNSGGASGTIDFGYGNVYTLDSGEQIMIPTGGKAYETTIIDATGTTIKVLYQN